MAKAFISYVTEDFEKVKRIADVLREFGVDLWLDRNSIKPGLRWTDEVRRGIAEGDFFLACFSKAHEAREKSYVHEELTQAIEQLRQRPTNRAWFLPIRLYECEVPDRPIGAGETLRSIQWIDLHTEWTAGMEELLSVLAPGSETIPRLIAQLDDASARRRVEAIAALGPIGPLAKSVIPRLIEQIEIEESDSVGMSGLSALAALSESISKIDPGAGPAFMRHIDSLFEKSTYVGRQMSTASMSGGRESNLLSQMNPQRCSITMW